MGLNGKHEERDIWGSAKESEQGGGDNQQRWIYMCCRDEL